MAEFRYRKFEKEYGISEVRWFDYGGVHGSKSTGYCPGSTTIRQAVTDFMNCKMEADCANFKPISIMEFEFNGVNPKEVVVYYQV